MDGTIVGGDGRAAIRRAGLEEILDLRHDVLRHGLPREAAIFPGDHDPSTRHYGGFIHGRNVACATLHPSTWEGEPAWRLRGMAVHAGSRGQGVGRALLQFLESDVLHDADGTQLLWCDARVPASAFYCTLRWEVVSPEFVIPTAGPHVKMLKRLIR